MSLSQSTQQSLLTLVKLTIVSQTEQLKDVTTDVNFFYEKADKEDPSTWQAFSMLNQARVVQRQLKANIQKYAGLSKELKKSIRKPQTTLSKAEFLQKRAAAKQWLEANKTAA